MSEKVEKSGLINIKNMYKQSVSSWACESNKHSFFNSIETFKWHESCRAVGSTSWKNHDSDYSQDLGVGIKIMMFKIVFKYMSNFFFLTET